MAAKKRAKRGASRDARALELDRLMRVRVDVRARLLAGHGRVELMQQFNDAEEALQSFDPSERYEWSRTEWRRDHERGDSWRKLAERYGDVPPEIAEARLLATVAARIQVDLERRFVFPDKLATSRREAEGVAQEVKWVRDSLASRYRATESNVADDEQALRLLFLRVVDVLSAHGVGSLRETWKVHFTPIADELPFGWDRVEPDFYRIEPQTSAALLTAWRNTKAGRRGKSKFALAHDAMVQMWGGVSVSVDRIEDQWRKFEKNRGKRTK